MRARRIVPALALACAPVAAQPLAPAAIGVDTVGHLAAIPARANRATMARHAARRVLLDVTRFGADPSGRRDSAPAIAATIAAAKRVHGPVTIRFPRGTYQVWPEATARRELYVSNTNGADRRGRIKRVALLIEDMADVIVEGAPGALLVFHGKQTAFAVLRSRDVTLRGLATDWYAPTVVDLTVIASGSDGGHGWRDVQIPPGTEVRIEGTRVTLLGEASPVTGERYWAYPPELAGNPGNQVRALASGRTWRTRMTLWDGLAAARLVAPGRLRLTYAAPGDPGGVGTVFEMRDDYRDTPGALIWQSRRTDLEDLTLHYLHGFGIVAQFSRDVTLDRLRLQAPPGTWRQTAGFADFVQTSGVAGTVQILNSLFDNPHDDPINVHGTYLAVEQVDRARRRVTLAYRHPQTAGFPQFGRGDAVRFTDRATMLPLAETLRVRAVDGPSGRDHAHDLVRMTLTLDRPLPAALVPGRTVADNATYTPSVRIAGNSFRSVPTRGILLTTPRPATIERNLFTGIHMACVYVSGDADQWYESGGVRDLAIRANLFDCPASPVLFFDPTNRATALPRTVHERIAIADNRFRVASATELVRAKSVATFAVTGNLVELADPATSRPADAPPAFAFADSRDILLGDNRVPPGFDARTAIADTGPVRTLPDLPPDEAATDEAALVDPAWTGLRFPAGEDPLVLVPPATRRIAARFVGRRPGTRITVTLNDDAVALAADGAASFPLADGPNVIEARTTRGAASRVYRWVVIVDAPGHATAAPAG